MPAKTKEEDVIKWLQENAPNIKLINWSGKATLKSKFVDIHNKREFEYNFNKIKSELKRRPNATFVSSKEDILRKRKKTCLEKYGVENVFQDRKIKENIKQINLERYGVEHIQQNEEIKEKRKKTCTEKYGADNPSKIKKFKEKRKNTFIKRYGVDNPNKTKSVRNKIKNTNLKRYGVENPQQSEKIKNKTKTTCLKKYGVKNVFQSEEIKNKIKQINIKKFGCQWSIQNKEVRKKIKNTFIGKYGFKNPAACEEIKKKIRSTNIENGYWTEIEGKTLREWSQDSSLASHSTILKAHKLGIHPSETKSYTSNIELVIKNLLIKNNIDFVSNKKLTEHKDLKYRFNKPDFLIKDFNLIIECDGDYPHANPRFFNENDIIKFSSGVQMTAKEIWKRDKKRDESYKNLGYTLLKFWGSEIINNWEKTENEIMLNLHKNVLK